MCNDLIVLPRHVPPWFRFWQIPEMFYKAWRCCVCVCETRFEMQESRKAGKILPPAVESINHTGKEPSREMQGAMPPSSPPLRLTDGLRAVLSLHCSYSAANMFSVDERAAGWSNPPRGEHQRRSAEEVKRSIKRRGENLSHACCSLSPGACVCVRV